MELDKLIEEFKNQTAQEQGDYIEPEDNAFDAPIPGQSLTDEPGNYPWEHAPQTASIEEATDYVYESIMKPKNMERMFTMLRMGIPIEAIVAMMITGEASLANIPAKVNLGDAGDEDFFKDMSERKYDMKQKEEQMEKELEMPGNNTPNVKGLMAKLGE